MKIVKEYADYIATFSKTHWLVITTKNRLSIARARRIMERLIKKFGIRTYFWIAEPHHEGGFHIHSCIDTKAHTTRIKTEIERMSAGGRTQVDKWKFTKDFRGEQYLSKMVGQECVDYDLDQEV